MADALEPGPDDAEYLAYTGTFSRIRNRYFERILARLQLPVGARMLDYGCGPGDFLTVARAAGIDASGIDAAERSVRMARARGLDVQLGDVDTIIAADTRYDAILVQSVLEHVEDGPALVAALKARLVPHGVLVLSAPTPGAYFWDDPTHVRPYTPRSFAVLAQLAGMRCEYNGYVWSFLLGLEIRASLFFRIMNLVPYALGSNLVAFLRNDEPSGVEQLR
jgi:2-polyprenyl-3-methyl-5-hydroxy-6-metoxy-1,4-benzoquinol methylase